jgi:hypothetical protein
LSAESEKKVTDWTYLSLYILEVSVANLDGVSYVHERVIVEAREREKKKAHRTINIFIAGRIHWAGEIIRPVNIELYRTPIPVPLQESHEGPSQARQRSKPLLGSLVARVTERVFIHFPQSYSVYSRLCHNPYLSVDSPGYGVLESMY